MWLSILGKGSMVLRSEIQSPIKSASAWRWEVAEGLLDYPLALTRMEMEVANIAAGQAELVWLVEHPPIYTAGTSAKLSDLVDHHRFSVYETGRGGQYTYHGPGQRVAYVMMDLKKRGNDVRAFVAALEDVIIQTLAHFGIIGERREDRVGVWVKHQSGESKIAAIGIRVRKGISFHGLSINLNPSLEHFSGIIPCGVTEHGVTSLENLGVEVNSAELDAALKAAFKTVFSS
jgi:lipoyl(octanoyl) transferase